MWPIAGFACRGKERVERSVEERINKIMQITKQHRKTEI